MKNILAVLVMILFILPFSSCGEKEEQEKTPEPVAEETLSFINEEFSFGVFFDKKGTQRQITIEKGQKELLAYIFVRFPEDNLPENARRYRPGAPSALSRW
ncbi:MAG: hypothetical protein KAX13_05915 [Candidatus Krumholzibacteria bacterium]|nr:hypothetical protein [Candidatus Krumholzibacteria bacterium]